MEVVNDMSCQKGKNKKIVRRKNDYSNIPEEFVVELLNAIYSNSFSRVLAEIERIREQDPTLDLSQALLSDKKTIYEWACTVGEEALVREMQSSGFLAPRDSKKMAACIELLNQSKNTDCKELSPDAYTRDTDCNDYPSLRGDEVANPVHLEADRQVMHMRIHRPPRTISGRPIGGSDVERQIPSDDGTPIERSVSVALSAAIDTGNWELTRLALDGLYQYYANEFNGDHDRIHNLLQSGILADGKTIYEYASSKGHVVITQQFFRLHELGIVPTDPKMLEKCNALMTSALQTTANDESMASITQLCSTYQSVQILRDKHTLASQYYNVRHHYLLFLPATILTALSAILAFLSTSFSSSSLQHILVIAVGIIATVSTLIQTISDQMGLSGKAEMHRTASHELDTILLSLEFNSLDTFKNSASFTEADLNVVRKQVSSVEASCSDGIPEILHSVYNPVLEELHFYFQEAMKVVDTDESVVQDQVLMGQRAVGMITKEISTYSGWPWRLSVKAISDRVMSKMLDQFNDVANLSAPDEEKGKRITTLAEVMKRIYSRNAVKVVPENGEL